MNLLIRKMSTGGILFLVSFFMGCVTQNKQEVISIRWQTDKATGIIIPISLLKENSDPQNRLIIQLIQPGERTPILGDFKIEDDKVIFEPLVPLTRGLRYEVILDNILISEIEIPKSESVPALIAIYPSQDTVPENLLKMYFRFSQPMVEGHSLSYITILNNNDTLTGTFLDLQPELWNPDGTLLTLWLDPGRIKRDLIPNREMGTPLKAQEKYTLTVSSNWKSKDGTSLVTKYTKTFVTASRDEQIPVADHWSIITPSSGTTQALKIDLNESLDYSLLMEAVQVVDSKKNPVVGTTRLVDEEQTLLFTPNATWNAGEYSLRIESRLEDLAGNNLNRLFDRDITKEKATNQEFFSRSFIIR